MRYQLLGPVELSDGTQPLRLSGPKRRAVLAVLLLNANQVVPEQQLLDLVWGDNPPATVRGQLQMYVSQLRKLIGEPVITRRAPGYLIEVRPGELDLDVFDEAVARARADREAGRIEAAVDGLRGALALWRGPALSDATEPLRAAAGPGLRERRLSALEEYFDAQLAAGHHTEVVADLGVAAEENPLRERLQALLMLALHRSGRTSEALAVYPATRARLVAEQGVEPGPLLQKAHRRLLSNEDEDGTAAPAAATPRQLPADMNRFAGRVADLARLDAMLTTSVGRAEVIVIGGGAGIGKTTLTVHWAHRVADGFPDGQLYVNLGGFGPCAKRTTPDEVVLGFLEALGVPPLRMPSSAEGKFSLYRSLLSEKRILIILDNARDADQVRPLLPGSPGCFTVVASRDQLPGLVAEGAYPITLDLPSAEEAKEILLRRVGRERVAREPGAVERITELCARLPLALAIVAARAVTNPGFALADLAAELSTARGGLDAFEVGDPAMDVRAVFSWSYTTLSPRAAKLFRLLGLHPEPHFSLSAAASLLGVPVREVRRLLAELTRAQLVTEHSPGHYGFHDLLRAYATELVLTEDSSEVRDAAIGRMLDHYLYTAELAAHHLRLPRGSIELGPVPEDVTLEPISESDAACWFGTNHPVLLAVVEVAVKAGFDRHVWQLAYALTSTYWYGGVRWLGDPGTYHAAIDAAGRLGDPVALAHGHRGLSIVYMALDRFDEAERELRKALPLFEKSGDVLFQGAVYHGLGWVCDRQGRWAEELDHALAGLDLYRQAGHPLGEGNALNCVAWAYARLGEHESAIVYGKQAVAILEGTDEHITLAAALDTLGFATQHLGRFEQAESWYRRAIALYRRVGTRHYESRTLARIGDGHLGRGELGEARRNWRKASELLDSLGLPDTERIRDKLASYPDDLDA
ncbi:tetratricopeptide repeat protein [Amycolatopsis rhizosphaerae]|uniref:Tetratricopeptide repeat protein n=1 Tax=Amycolatopsis rhizosphaerae TaxID=2053003 RepID=A0A558CVL2_9PSEU|nr:BTAD domain-containing putative transcriptional regulator [Amycolatopsis rhizosphaerae]TVT52811.1 tetratricopeptide repeat protein [Amycolatopsis rhizosphaerae]